MLCALCNQSDAPTERFFTAVQSSCFPQQTADLKQHVPLVHHWLSCLCGKLCSLVLELLSLTHTFSSFSLPCHSSGAGLCSFLASSISSLTTNDLIFLPNSRAFLPTFSTMCPDGVSFCPEYHHQPLFFTQPSQTPFWDMDQQETHLAPPQNTPFPGLILTVGKMNYCLGKKDPIWAKCLKSGQI